MNEDGLTLIETLVALSVMIGCVLFFSLALTQIQSVRTNIGDDRQIEWHLFLNQMEYELKDKVLVDVTSTAINVMQVKDRHVQTDTISYDVLNSIYRRTVNKSGHQPMLTKIKTIRIDYKDKQIQIDVTFDNNESYRGKLKVKELNEK